ncbi:hypothetical protein CEXT_466211 [Caerostris extrusa]|uniref:Uncharacterized protein n=1 Tax=Caerostris extrusa TaxID=172846 RepID=A0AAV4WT10_CAEEX|nr:hypothetical protein CEXT_466211 [Caerostris extrusa]
MGAVDESPIIHELRASWKSEMAKELDTDERSFRLAPDPDGPLSLFFISLPSKSACLYLYLLFKSDGLPFGSDSWKAAEAQLLGWYG